GRHLRWQSAAPFPSAFLDSLRPCTNATRGGCSSQVHRPIVSIIFKEKKSWIQERMPWDFLFIAVILALVKPLERRLFRRQQSRHVKNID
ncbi:MAG: hypothetical protein ABSF34_06780, partial [Verrucomicrobiota bacterium]